MKRKIIIGEKCFTDTGKIIELKPINAYRFRKLSGRTLKECYTKPSATKQEIFNEWLKWSEENNVQCFGVCSYNTNIFTLDGLIKINDTLYYLYITPSRKELYIVQK